VRELGLSYYLGALGVWRGHLLRPATIKITHMRVLWSRLGLWSPHLFTPSFMDKDYTTSNTVCTACAIGMCTSTCWSRHGFDHELALVMVILMACTGWPIWESKARPVVAAGAVEGRFPNGNAAGNHWMRHGIAPCAGEKGRGMKLGDHGPRMFQCRADCTQQAGHTGGRGRLPLCLPSSAAAQTEES
jgi:hypothetical protein